MLFLRFLIAPLLLIFSFYFTYSQTKSAGPIIEDFGKVFVVTQPDFPVDASLTYKVVFDVTNTPDEKDKLNPYLETAARFLNMHAQNGIPADQLEVAVVVHSAASKDIISNSAYQQRYGVGNPNEKLIEALLKANTQIIFCGQSAQARGFPKEELIPGVQLALSAMTALIQLQGQDYKFIKF